MTQEDLKKTSIVSHFNTFRKLVKDTVLAKRLKELVRLWCRQEEQRNNGPPLVNGDSRGAEAPTHSNDLPRHPTAIQKHKNKTHTSFNHKLATQISNTGFKISIPLSKVRLRNYNNLATHSNNPFQRPDYNPARHTQQTPNLSSNNLSIKCISLLKSGPQGQMVFPFEQRSIWPYNQTCLFYDNRVCPKVCPTPSSITIPSSV